MSLEEEKNMFTNQSDDESEEERSFKETYTPWTRQDCEWLWEQYRNGKPIHEICEILDRFPDDVITYMCIHSQIRPEDIQGFGGPCHLALWKEQQEAFQTNPLFEIRKEIQRQESNERIYNMLTLLLNRRK